MICSPTSISGAERFGGRRSASLLLSIPALLWAGQYIREPELQRYYRDVLNILPIGAPALVLFWVAALLRLFWPERLPGPLSSGSTHMKYAVMLGRGLFWTAAVCFTGAVLMSFLGWTGKGSHGNPLAVVSCVCLGIGFAVWEYVKFRREPGSCTESLIEPSMLLMLVPVLILLGMMLIVSWDKPGWTIGIGGLSLVMLWTYVRLVKKTLARRRERINMVTPNGASSPTS